MGREDSGMGRGVNWKKWRERWRREEVVRRRRQKKIESSVDRREKKLVGGASLRKARTVE